MNELKNEKSPYLLQHAGNPVNWYPWCDEAFEEAKKNDKPVFLSIGYSTCHWCHVMEEESFEDAEVAKLMNEAFVSVKVDREERPDIDNIYMTVCQAMTGSGGWPLTIIMTPDKEPFYAATYIPKETRFGIAGLKELIPNISYAWKTQREKIEKSANEVSSYLKNIYSVAPASGDELTANTLEKAFSQLSQRFDREYGGFGNAPKFPTPHNLMFLLRYWKRNRFATEQSQASDDALDMVKKTLSQMRMGGIYDHIGFGFHRYSTDSKWLVPHFEKMLYDQALLAMAYTEAYQVTGEPEFKQTAEEILAYVLRDMSSPEGGFYSAEDADSEGVEGKFYLWTSNEIENVLGKKAADEFRNVYNLDSSGILHTRSVRPPGEHFESARQKLFEYRNERIRPHKDDKILTDWNGLMLAAFSKASKAFNEPKYGDAAKKAADFILSTLRQNNGRLLHRYREGESAIPGNLDDYAFIIFGLLELYETNFEVKYLQTAIELNNIMLLQFWDANGGFFLTADDSEKLLTRPKEYYDGAIPSGNSVAMLNLLRLGRITMNRDFEDKAAALSQSFSANINQSPMAYTFLMSALDFALGPSYEIVISGTSNKTDTKEMLAALDKLFIPNKIVILRPAKDETAITEISPFTKNQASINGKPTAYVCRNYSCELPTTDTKQMLKHLEQK